MLEDMLARRVTFARRVFLGRRVIVPESKKKNIYKVNNIIKMLPTEGKGLGQQ